MLGFVSILFHVCLVEGIAWRSTSYWGIPVGDDDVGAVIFDPGIGTANSECFDTVGEVTVGVPFCPIASQSYFTAKNNKIVLAAVYSLSEARHTPFLPDCRMQCWDSTGQMAETSLNILIYSTENKPPVWDHTFPTVITVETLHPIALLIKTPAHDPDLDKTTNGNLTYSVISIDGSPVVSGINNFLQYANNGQSPELLVVYTLPWERGSTHNVTIAVKDNPNNGDANTITKVLTLQVASTATIGGSIIAPTASTSLNTDPAALLTNADGSFIGFTTTASDSCSGIDIVVCGNNWIWLTIAACGLVALIVVIVVAVVCWCRYASKDKVVYMKVKKTRPHRRSVYPDADYPSPRHTQVSNQLGYSNPDVQSTARY